VALLIFSIFLDIIWFFVWGKIYSELGSLCTLIKILTILKTLMKIGLIGMLYMNDGDVRKSLNFRTMKDDLLNLFTLKEEEGNAYV
jgi:hypothetical protein